MCQKKTKHESEMMKLTSIPCYLIARRVCVCVCGGGGGGGGGIKIVGYMD